MFNPDVFLIICLHFLLCYYINEQSNLIDLFRQNKTSNFFNCFILQINTNVAIMTPLGHPWCNIKSLLSDKFSPVAKLGNFCNITNN